MFKVPSGFNPVKYSTNGKTYDATREDICKLGGDPDKYDRSPQFYIKDKIPILPILHLGNIWHTGWDIPTEWAIDSIGQCWMDGAHGGAMQPVEKSTLISCTEDENEANTFRRYLGIKEEPPTWQKIALANGWTPPA